jgi:hypothetical protein
VARGARTSTDLAVGGAVVLDGPAGLGAHGLEHFVVVAVLGQLVVAVAAQPGEDLGRDGAPAPLPPLVVLALPPCGQPRPRRHLPKMLHLTPRPPSNAHYSRTKQSSPMPASCTMQAWARIIGSLAPLHSDPWHMCSHMFTGRSRVAPLQGS